MYHRYHGWSWDSWSIWSTLSHITVPWTPRLGCLIAGFSTVGCWPVEENHKDLEHLGTIQTLRLCIQNPGVGSGVEERTLIWGDHPGPVVLPVHCITLTSWQSMTELCPSKANVDSAGHTGTTTSSWFNATSPALTRWVRYEDDIRWLYMTANVCIWLVWGGPPPPPNNLGILYNSHFFLPPLNIFLFTFNLLLIDFNLALINFNLLLIYF